MGLVFIDAGLCFVKEGSFFYHLVVLFNNICMSCWQSLFYEIRFKVFYKSLKMCKN